MSEKKGQSPWDELDIPSGGEISVSELEGYKWNKFTPGHVNQPGGWTNEQLRDALRKELRTGNLVLRGPAQIVKGEQPSVGATTDLIMALETLFDFPVTADIYHQQWFLDVATTDKGKIATARLKGLGGIVHPKTPDHIIVSKGLAQNLGLGGALGLGGKDILIQGFTAGDIEDLDLDTGL